MNTISWALYLASVAEDVNGACMVVAGLAIVGAVVACVIAGAHRATAMDDEDRATAGGFLRSGRKLAIIAGCALAVGTIVPERSTVLMIAASEAGETFAKTPEAQELLTEIREAIRAQLRSIKERKP